MDAVDCKIQNARQTGWPFVSGTSVKGAIRANAQRSRGENHDSIFSRLFGSPSSIKDAEYNTGALSVGDAQLLLLPMRSSPNNFHWVTCPAVLRRLNDQLPLIGSIDQDAFSVPSVATNEVAVTEPSESAYLCLDEYRLHEKLLVNDSILDFISSNLIWPGFDAWAGHVRQNHPYAVVSNELFEHFCEIGLRVNTNVVMGNKSGLQSTEKLRHGKMLQSNTVFYTPIRTMCSLAILGLSSNEIISFIMNNVFGTHPFLQLGENCAVGIGQCRVGFVRGA